MRKIIVLSFVSLDGVIQAPGGPEEDTSGGFRYGGWSFPYLDEESGKLMENQMSKGSDLLLGRKTFEIFASYWPHHESEWPGINSVRKYVVSKTLSTSNWNNSVFLKGNIPGEIRKLKQQDGPDIQVHGSGNLIQTLLREDLVDELWLKIFPLTLGPGKKLFDNGSVPAAFRLTGHTVTKVGVIFASYERNGDVRTGSFGA
jgi:dihydrofolate reductase